MIKNVEFKLAETRGEIEESYSLVWSRYVEKNYLRDWPFDLWVTPYCLHPSTIVILATLENKIVGTATVFRCNEMGLPLFNLCPEAKHIGMDIFEIGKLAVAKEMGDNIFSSVAGIGLIMGMFSVMYRCGLWFRENEFPNADFDICIAVVPSHRPFYSKLGFKTINNTPSVYKVFKDVVAYCMRQSFSNFLNYIQNHYMLRKFFGLLESLNPNKRYFMNWDDVVYFSQKRTNLWERMDNDLKVFLADAYGVNLEV